MISHMEIVINSSFMIHMLNLRYISEIDRLYGFSAHFVCFLYFYVVLYVFHAKAEAHPSTVFCHAAP